MHQMASGGHDGDTFRGKQKPARKLVFKRMTLEGFEPSTQGLKVLCSATELQGRLLPLRCLGCNGWQLEHYTYTPSHFNP